EHPRVRPDGRLLVPRRYHHGRTDKRPEPLGKRTAARPPSQSDDAITQQLPRCVGRGHTTTVEPLPLQVRELVPFAPLAERETKPREVCWPCAPTPRLWTS